MRFSFRNCILYWILFPVLAMAMLLALLLITYALPPVFAHFSSRVDADLQMASSLGIATCENSFNYLLDLRLENDPEMNASLKRETLAEVKAISRNFHHIQMLAIEDNQRILETSDHPAGVNLELPDFASLPRTVSSQDFWGEPLRIHHRYFPFWNWQIASYITEMDYQAPVLLAKKAIYLIVFICLAVLITTLVLAFKLFVDRPIKRLIDAAEDMADGQ